MGFVEWYVLVGIVTMVFTLIFVFKDEVRENKKDTVYRINQSYTEFENNLFFNKQDIFRNLFSSNADKKGAFKYKIKKNKLTVKKSMEHLVCEIELSDDVVYLKCKNKNLIIHPLLLFWGMKYWALLIGFFAFMFKVFSDSFVMNINLLYYVISIVVICLMIPYLRLISIAPIVWVAFGFNKLKKRNELQIDNLTKVNETLKYIFEDDIQIIEKQT